jgi:hypothetical protein
VAQSIDRFELSSVAVIWDGILEVNTRHEVCELLGLPVGAPKAGWRRLEPGIQRRLERFVVLAATVEAERKVALFADGESK